MGFDCDNPSAVIDALYWNHNGGNGPALPPPNMVVERRSNGHCHASWFLSRPVHRGEAARAAPLRKLARINEFFREVLQADVGYNGTLTHNPLPETHGPGEFQTNWPCSSSLLARRTGRAHSKGLALAGQTDYRHGPELCAVRFADEVGGITVQSQGRGHSHGTGHQ